ncbi:MAG: hypothetical protein NXI32_04965 [bacterium]|nr:hypothetical protein [bacterium]
MTQPTPAEIRTAFQYVADACGGDILQCCIDCGIEPEITRDCLIDYLAIHGGPKGKEVFDWVVDCAGNIHDLDRKLDEMGVPHRWV